MRSHILQHVNKNQFANLVNDFFLKWHKMEHTIFHHVHLKKLFEVLHGHSFPLCIQPYKAKKYDLSVKCQIN
jgi:hypothetical protein